MLQIFFALNLTNLSIILLELTGFLTWMRNFSGSNSQISDFSFVTTASRPWVPYRRKVLFWKKKEKTTLELLPTDDPLPVCERRFLTRSASLTRQKIDLENCCFRGGATGVNGAPPGSAARWHLARGGGTTSQLDPTSFLVVPPSDSRLRPSSWSFWVQ